MRKPHLRLTLHYSVGVNNETAMQSYYIRHENYGFGVCFYVNLEIAGIGTKATFTKVGLVGKIPLQLSSQGFLYVLSLSIRMVYGTKTPTSYAFSTAASCNLQSAMYLPMFFICTNSQLRSHLMALSNTQPCTHIHTHIHTTET